MRALSSVETAFASTASQEHIIPGLLAQLVEHLVYTEGVRGSSPLGPTNLFCFDSLAKIAKLVKARV